MKRSAHPFVPAALLLLAAFAALPLHAASPEAVASPAVISQLFCSANRTAAQLPAQGLNPNPLPMLSRTCGCIEIACQGFPTGTACISGILCGESVGHGPGVECYCEP
jgi:hypothetical protein